MSYCCLQIDIGHALHFNSIQYRKRNDINVKRVIDFRKKRIGTLTSPKKIKLLICIFLCITPCFFSCLTFNPEGDTMNNNMCMVSDLQWLPSSLHIFILLYFLTTLLGNVAWPLTYWDECQCHFNSSLYQIHSNLPLNLLCSQEGIDLTGEAELLKMYKVSLNFIFEACILHCLRTTAAEEYPSAHI